MKELEKRLRINAELLKSTVEAPFDIGVEIKKEELKMKKRKIACTAAGAAAAFVLVFNCAPNLARAASNVPILGAAVKIVTLGRYEVHEGGYDAKVVTPQLEGLLDKETEDRLNKEFKENAAAVIAAFEEDIRDLKAEFGEDETIHMGVESNYTVRTDNDEVLALDCYLFSAAGSSYTKHSFYNIDKKSGKLITFESLFGDEDYITPISEYITAEMRRQNEAGENQCPYWIAGEDDSGFEGFDKISDKTGFYINDSGEIVICFDKYEVAPGAMGCPEFVIPESVIASLRK